MSFKQKVGNWIGTGLVVLACAAVGGFVGNASSMGSPQQKQSTSELVEIANQTIEAVSPGGFVLVPIQRVFDSRKAFNVGVVPGNWYGVGTGVKNEDMAYVTLTVTTPGCGGFLGVSTTPGGPPSPDAPSFLNWGSPGDIVSNSTFVPITNAGDFWIWVPPTTCPVQLIVDLIGYVQR